MHSNHRHYESEFARATTTRSIASIIAAPALVVAGVFGVVGAPVGDAQADHVGVRRALVAQSADHVGATPAQALNSNSASSPDGAATPGQVGVVAWAHARFGAAGLELPEVSVAFERDSGPCGGHLGRYRRSERLIQICVSEHAADAVLRQLVLHELAHAWTHVNLTDRARDGFIDLRGVSTWNSWDVRWADRGIEHAAEVIAWGVMDVPISVKSIGDTSDASLEAAFAYLTGMQPINEGSHPSADPTRPATAPIVDRH